MTEEEINRLISKGLFSEPTEHTELVETHISWVILCDQYVYKIKKPIKYSFLDFSTLEKRKFYCKRELELNQRFSKNIYLEVLPIYERGGQYQVGGSEGPVVDYTLKMRKLDPEKQMDLLLSNNEVSESDIKNLADRIVQFHKNSAIIDEKNIMEIRDEFKDLGSQTVFLSHLLDMDADRIINHAIEFSDTFLTKNRSLLQTRLKSGFFRDCHGDLHTRNIFLLPAPQPFDCIEFNDEFRQLDVLNEVAFLCMDLDALGRNELSSLFIEQYNDLFPTIRTDADRRLFTFYKSYRANVRAKVNSLRASSETDPSERTNALAEVSKYLLLMQSYIKSLEDS